MNNESANIKSLGGNLWKVASVDERLVDFLADKYNLPYLVAKVLVLRGVGKDEVSCFLNPKLQFLMPNPSVLKDVEKAAAKLEKRAFEGSEKLAKMLLKATSRYPE